MVVVALVVGINSGLMYLLHPYTTSRYEIGQLESGAYNQLIVGSSHGKCGIDPQILTEETGLNTFNICKGGEYPEDALYLVKEAARRNDLKRVIYEVDPGYWEVKPNQTADYVLFYHDMPFSAVKAAYFLDKMPEADYRTCLTPWYLYRNNLNKIKDIVSVKRSEVYKSCEVAESFSSEGQTYTARGFFAVNHLPTDKTKEDTPILWSGKGARDKSLQAAEKLVAFCQDNNIELVIVMTPIPNVTYKTYRDNYEAAARFMTAFAESREVKFLNYWNSADEAVPQSLDDFMDYDGHMYKEAAAAFSVVLSQDLTEKRMGK